MPSGIKHDRITVWILPWIAGGTYSLTLQGELTLIVCSGFLFSGFMFGPDLDIYSLQYKRWGILRAIWLPYRKIMRHRSLFSHGLIIGTCIRVLYLLLVISIVAIFVIAIAQLIWGFTWNWQQFVQQKSNLLTTQYLAEVVGLFAGLELGAMSHSLSDWISSTCKYRRKKKQQKNQTNKTKIRK